MSNTRKAYISVSFPNRALVQNELKTISELLVTLDIVPFIFVDKYGFSPADESQMMAQAMADNSDTAGAIGVYNEILQANPNDAEAKLRLHKLLRE